MSDSDDSSTLQQRANGALINVERGRAPDFVDGPLPDGAQPTIAQPTVEQPALTDHEQLGREVEANGAFMNALQERINAQSPTLIAPTDMDGHERQALIYLMAAQRVLPVPDSAFGIAGFFTATLNFMAPWFHHHRFDGGMPDRAISAFELANRLFDEAHAQVTAGSRTLQQGNPFRSPQGLRLLRADLLASANAFVRRAVRAARWGEPNYNRLAFWNHVQMSIWLVTNDMDDDEAGQIFWTV